MRFFLSAGLFFSVLLLTGGLSYAQTFDSLSEIEVSIHLSPEFPQANQQVTATVTASGGNARTATIVWLLGDEVQQQESGGDTFVFTTGDTGSEQNLSVLVKTTNGEIFNTSIVVSPVEVTLLWEGDTFVPPFYKGRSLYSSGSFIRAEAIANFIDETGIAYDSSELLYTWSKNGTVLGSLSGVGADTLVTEGPKFFGDYILAVEVTSPDGTKRSQSASRIDTREPQVVLYEKSPLIGVLTNTAINDGHVFADSSQIEVHAIPYFMDIRNENDSQLSYTWNINGTKVSGSDAEPSSLTIQLPSEENISTSIRITIDHVKHLLQSAQGMFTITFSGSARSSLFGL